MLMFSIKPKWARMILNGSKTYELRRRPPPSKAIGEIALIYCTTPETRLMCACRVENIVAKQKDILWEEIGEHTGCDASEFSAYFQGLEYASAVQLKALNIKIANLTRNELKTKYGFTPPQSWRWANELEELVGDT